MAEIELGAVQERFADLVRAHEPIASGELVGICEKELNRKKPTTYLTHSSFPRRSNGENWRSIVFPNARE